MKRKCKNEGCNNWAIAKRRECCRCKSRQYRSRNLRTNAKRRGHDFDLTFEEFVLFCIKTDYIAQKGITKESFSIDRIDNERGYSMDNIRILTVSENAKKYTRKVEFDYLHTQSFYVRWVDSPTGAVVNNEGDCPF